jgi:hypothetical protein
MAEGAPMPCGFTFANQQWQWCRADGVNQSIGTVGQVDVNTYYIKVKESLFGMAPGTIILP